MLTLYISTVNSFPLIWIFSLGFSCNFSRHKLYVCINLLLILYVKSIFHLHCFILSRVGSLYRSTCSIPAVLPSHPRADSPRSTRSAPWTQPHVRGLYTSSSPRSVRSAGNNSQLLNRLTRRSSSVESQSSNDSRSCKRFCLHYTNLENNILTVALYTRVGD